jgi:hypothetical protein
MRNDRVSAALTALAEDSEIAGWDGFDALPICTSSIYAARRFLTLVPRTLPVPEAFCSDVGYIVFEWYFSFRKRVTLHIMDNGFIHCAWDSTGAQKEAILEETKLGRPPRVSQVITGFNKMHDKKESL